MPSEPIPSRVGRYEPRKEVGRGTMGVVYEAWDPDLGRTIALKVVAPAFGAPGPDREAYERRFLTEARAAARLSHPGIVVVHDVGRDPDSGHVYMALEYLAGASLQDRLAAGPLPWAEALRIVGRVADALHHAHTKGVVHRDVKPANIMILPSGEPKILDFGIARVDASLHTLPGEMFGTPLYMSPEQALGGPADARSDLFALGAVAYAALCGRPAFAGGTVPAVVAAITQREPQPPSELVSGLPGAVDDVLARAMAKSPADRYDDVRMFADDVEDVLAQRPPRHRAGWTPPVAARTIASAAAGEATLPELELVEPPAPAARPGRRRRGRATLTLFALLVVVAAVYFALHRSDVAFWSRELPRLAAALRAYGDKVTVVPTTPGDAPARVVVVSAPGRVATGAGAATAAASPAPAGPGETAVSPPARTASPAEQSPLALARRPEPTPSAPPAAAKRAPVVRASGQLVLDVEHQPDAGTLEVWVDGARLLEQRLGPRTRRKTALTLEAGRHQIEVRLKGSRGTRAARTAGTVKAGTTRRLGVTVLRGGVPALEWR